MAKVCNKCLESKDDQSFARHNGSKGGLRSDCKECRKNYAAKWYQANKERVDSKNKAWAASNRDKIRSIRERFLARNPNYKTRHTVNKYHSDEKTRDAILTRTRNRRAIHKGSRGKHDIFDIRDLFTAQDAKCKSCGCDISGGYEVDHIMPLALNGSNDKGNLQLLCRSCNRKKGKKHPDVWLKELESVA